MEQVANKLFIPEEFLSTEIKKYIQFEKVETIDILVEDLRSSIESLAEKGSEAIIENFLKKGNFQEYFKGLDNQEQQLLLNFFKTEYCELFRKRWEYYNQNSREGYKLNLFNLK